MNLFTNSYEASGGRSASTTLLALVVLGVFLGSMAWAQTTQPGPGKQTGKPAPEKQAEAGEKQPGTKPRSQPAAKNDRSTPAGKALLAKVIEASGGVEAFAALSSLTWEGRDTRVTPSGVLENDIKGIVQFPGERFRMEQRRGGQEVVFVVTESAGWQKSSRGLQDLPNATLVRFRKGLKVSTTPLLKAHAELEAKELPTDVLGGREFLILRVWRGAEGPIDFFIDPDSHQILRKKQSVVANGQETVREEKMWDYRKVGSLNLPFSRSVFENGSNTGTISILKYTLNRDLPANTFQRPGADKP